MEESLLLASITEKRDVTTRQRGRHSDTSLVCNGNDEEALVCIHKIRRDDTLAGIILKYGCQQASFRRVNRLWPHYSIQTRSYIFLLVEVCSVGGKKVEEIQAEVFKSTQKIRTPDEATQWRTATRQFGSATDSVVASSPIMTNAYLNLLVAADGVLKHYCWLKIASFSEPVEVSCMPRRSLGHFPRV